MTKRREKQSESLEVRLGYSSKQAFMDACRERGLTASEVVREFVETYPVKSHRPGWPVQKLKEPAMNLSAVVLLSAALGTSAILPTAATADRNDPAEQFNEIDTDGDGYFNRVDLYALAGLTPEGQLTSEMRANVVASMQASIRDLDMMVQETTLSPAFIERTLIQAQGAAAESVSQLFEDFDDDGDGLVSRAEFFRYSNHYVTHGPGLTGPAVIIDEPGLTGPELER